MDGMGVKLRKDEVVSNVTVYVILGIDLQKAKHVFKLDMLSGFKTYL